jgi:hypothetical protein
VQDAVEVKAPKGSLFLWDGELLHCNAPKSTTGYRVGLVGHFTRPWNIIAQQARLLFVSSAFTFPNGASCRPIPVGTGFAWSRVHGGASPLFSGLADASRARGRHSRVSTAA